MIYWDFRKWIYLSISNPKKTINKLKGIFKPLKCYFKFDVNKWTPYPVLWVSKPAYIHIMFHDVTWKDKFDTPRYEVPPYIWIHLFKWNFLWYWNLPDTIEYNLKSDYIDDYWEQALWYLYYYNTYSQGLLDEPNIEKARESWPWQDTHNNSSWNNKFLMK
jgi:hypothetical protein